MLDKLLNLFKPKKEIKNIILLKEKPKLKYTVKDGKLYRRCSIQTAPYYGQGDKPRRSWAYIRKEYCSKYYRELNINVKSDGCNKDQIERCWEDCKYKERSNYEE
jgi:hypothetical protein